jgi:hypothetical protein
MNICFADYGNGCKALTVKKCKGCSFFKTREEVREGRIKAIQRILSLDKETRDFIIETYYNSKLEV